jgi:selenocysteine-specific translation elongation factor
VTGYTVAVVGARDIAAELGKRGTVSDLTLFNATGEGHAVTFVEPTQYPEKLASLLFALRMSERALFIVPGLSKEVAETATALDLLDLPVELLVGTGVGPDELRRAFKGMRFVADPVRPLDLLKLREEIDSWRSEARPGGPRVPIDHAFPVRGVGAVALGVVQIGPLRAHARLRLYPTPKEVEVRSVQVHDVDVPEAATGDRVGVALKGVDADELERGQVLAEPGALLVGSSVRGSAYRSCPYYRGDLRAGTHLHLSVGLQFVPAVVESLAGGAITVSTDRPVAFAAGDTGVLADLSAVSGSRMVGRFTLASASEA